MSELTDAMDVYVEAVNRHRGSMTVGAPDSDPEPSPVELRSRDFVEACCERAVPDHIWEFWSHPLLDDAHNGWCPYPIYLAGAENLFRVEGELFIDAPFHPDVQIPLLSIEAWPILVDRFDVPGELWFGTVGANRDTLHRSVMTLPEIFSTWAEALDGGLMRVEVWEGDETAHVEQEIVDGTVWPTLAARSRYAGSGEAFDVPDGLVVEATLGVPGAGDDDAWFCRDDAFVEVNRRRARFEELTGRSYPQPS